MGDESTESPVLGIDLGTTNSAMAIHQGGEPEIIENRDGERTTPSVVGVDGEGITVGQPAKNQAVKNPEETITSIKREMGTDSTVSLNGKSYDPETISSFILKKLKKDAELRLDQAVDRAVITVPAYFDDAQRKATQEAGTIAGFEVERIINEPTAAALAYGLEDTDSTQKVLVYDLGGGTFDVSILRIGDAVQEVIATDGDTNLGGVDWDERLIDLIVERFIESHPEEDLDKETLRGDPVRAQRLKEEAEEAKKRLSRARTADINLPFFLTTDDGGIHLEQTIQRHEFEEITADLLDQTVGPTERVLRDAPFPADALDTVLLVGGSTNMPMVQKKVEEITGIRPSLGVDPDEAVALGAATQGGIMSGRVDEMVLVDVTPLSLGVEVEGGLFEPIIPRDTSIPTVESKPFTTAEDNQTEVRVRVYQGERSIAEENEFLGEFVLSGIDPAPAGAPKITVRFKIDEDGIVHVAAEDEASGQSDSITLEGGTGLSEEEIERRREEADKFAEQDQQRVERERASQKAHKLADSVRKELGEETQSVSESLLEQAETALTRLADHERADEQSTSTYKEIAATLKSVLTELREPDAEPGPARDTTSEEPTADSSLDDQAPAPVATSNPAPDPSDQPQEAKANTPDSTSGTEVNSEPSSTADTSLSDPEEGISSMFDDGASKEGETPVSTTSGSGPGDETNTSSEAPGGNESGSGVAREDAQSESDTNADPDIETDRVGVTTKDQCQESESDQSRSDSLGTVNGGQTDTSDDDTSDEEPADATDQEGIVTPDVDLDDGKDYAQNVIGDQDEDD